MPQPLRSLTPAKGPGHQFGAALRARRTAAGLTQQALALLVPVSAALIGKIEKAERRCDVRLARRLDTVLGAAGALLAEWRRTLGAALTPMPTEPVARPLPAPGPWAGWDDALDIADQTSLLAGSNVDNTALVVLAACCDDLVARYEAEGPLVLAPTGRRLRAQLHHLLAGQQHPAQRHRLYELAAMASGLLAYMSVNAGRLPLARAYCDEALTLAQAIEASDLIAWTRGTQSLEAYYAGRYLDARDFALTGIDAAPTSPQAVRLLANGAARALAKLGDRQAAEQALDRALTLSDRHELPGGLTSCISFGAYGLARTLANAATVHQLLGDTPHRAALRRRNRPARRSRRLRLEPRPRHPRCRHRPAQPALPRDRARHAAGPSRPHVQRQPPHPVRGPTRW